MTFGGVNLGYTLHPIRNPVQGIGYRYLTPVIGVQAVCRLSSVRDIQSRTHIKSNPPRLAIDQDGSDGVAPVVEGDEGADWSRTVVRHGAQALTYGLDQRRYRLTVVLFRYGT